MAKKKKTYTDDSGSMKKMHPPEDVPNNVTKLVPKPEPQISVGQFVQELNSKEWITGRGFEIHMRVEAKKGRKVRKSGTQQEWRQEFNQWRSSPVG